MKGQPQPLTRGQRIIVALFATGSLVAGLSLLGGIAEAFYGYWRTRGEVTVDARLRSVELKIAHRQRSTVAHYDYAFAGRSFTGSRITIFSPSGRYYPRLSSALHSNTPIRVFIDPTHPKFSVIDRNFYWWPLIVALPFSLVFTAGGVFVLWCARRAPRPQ